MKMKLVKMTPFVMGTLWRHLLFFKLETDEAATGLPEVIDGYFALPTGYGLGLEINEEAIKAYPRTESHFNLFQEDWQKRNGHK